MSDNRLTPRVGDRVLIISGGVTYAGNAIARKNADDEWLITVDGIASAFYRRIDGIEVRDREPVEWSEGWRTHDSPHERAVLSVPGGYAHILSKIEIEKILADGPYIIEHWDELIRNDA